MQPLLTDGPRLFFTESEHDRGLLASVSVTGGDTLTIPAPPGLDLLDISPDKSQLLIATPGADGKPTHLCILPVTGGAVRALGIAATDAAWSPDGTEVAYAEHQNLFIASIDGSRARRLAAAPGPINWLRWSPDGTRLSFTIEDLQAETYSIWDVRVAQAVPRDILNGVAKPPHACCAEWTPDGNYLVFQARHEGRSDIWAIATSELEKEKVQPIRLTAGPLKYSVPVPSLDGKRLFAIGRENRGELMQFNLKSHEFTDYLSGVSGIEASFSRDGKWVAYVSYPEYELWRCRVDGTDALKLTSSDEREAAEPQWSPDGKRIAFMSVQSGKHFKAYVVPAAGGVPEPLIASGNEEGVPTWSPDGKSVVYGEVLYRKPASQMAIHLFDLRTRQLSTIPGSQGLWTPRWSPDGQYIVALAARDDASSPSMWLYSMKARKWALLAKLNDINEPAWAPKGDYIYFTTQNSNTNPALYRIRVPDHRLEKLADLSTIPLVHGCTSVTPDGSPLVVRDISSQEIYALDWNLH